MEMNSETSSRSPSTAPKNVTFLDSSYLTFRYPITIPLGKSFRIGDKLTYENIKGANFSFELVKTSRRTILIICRRNFTEPVERDDGYILRLYISVIGVVEKTRCAVLGSTDTFTYVEFMEESFTHPKIRWKDINILKCVFRRIETTIVSNEVRVEQERIWQAKVLKVCKESKKKEDMAYVLKCPNLQGIFTGRKINHHVKSTLVKRACWYSKELAEYFRAKENTRSCLSEINLGKILGYMLYREEKVIDYSGCITLYIYAIRLGLMFLKEIATDYLIENLNSVNNQSLVHILRIADVTEDSRLFSAVFRFWWTYKPQIFDSDEWRVLAYNEIYCPITHSILFGFLLRIFTDCGFPPGMEEETAEI